MKRTMRKLLITLQFFCVFFSSACAGITELGGIDEYEAFLNNLVRYTQYEVYAAPPVAGFKPLIQAGFEYGAPFNGNYTYVVYEGLELLLSREGSLYYAPESLLGKDLRSDTYIFEENGKLGVKTVFGEIRVNPVYYEIEVFGDLTAATDITGKYDVFYKSQRLYKGLSGIYLYSDTILLYNGKLCGLDLKPLTDGIYDIVSETINGMYYISDGRFLGYGGEQLIAPVFAEVRPFNLSGFACVKSAEFGYGIINKAGEVIYTQRGTVYPVNFDGIYVTFYDTQESRYGIADANFEPFSDERFSYVHAYAVYNGYLILNPPGTFTRFYSVKNDFFLPGLYDSITPFNEYFLVRNTDGTYSLLDAELEPVLENCDSLSFDGTFLTVEKDGKYHYYIKE